MSTGKCPLEMWLSLSLLSQHLMEPLSFAARASQGFAKLDTVNIENQGPKQPSTTVTVCKTSLTVVSVVTASFADSATVVSVVTASFADSASVVSVVTASFADSATVVSVVSYVSLYTKIKQL